MTINAPILRVGAVAEAEYGPQRSIGASSPAPGAIEINTVDHPTHADIQTEITAAAEGAVFWIRAGSYAFTGHIIPKTGQQFIGEYGAIFDGSGWTIADPTASPDEGAFYALSLGSVRSNVVIRNLEIRHMPRYGIESYFDSASGWTVEYCKVWDCRYGIGISPNFVIKHNWFYDCAGIPFPAPAYQRGGGYVGDRCDGALIEHNEIGPDNGQEQKIAASSLVDSKGVTFRNNYIHDNPIAGIWFDTLYATGGSANILVEDNLCEDNGREGIILEACEGTSSVPCIVRNNTVRRSGDSNIKITNTIYAEVTGNTLEDGQQAGIQIYRNFDGGAGEDLANNTFSDNTITASAGQYTVMGSLNGTSTAPERTALIANTNANDFSNNHYVVPDADLEWFYWFNEAPSEGGDILTWGGWNAVERVSGGFQDDDGDIVEG